MGNWVVLDLIRHEVAWAGGPLTPQDLAALSRRFRGRRQSDASAMLGSRLMLVRRVPVAEVLHVVDGLVVIHEAVFYDDAHAYREIRRLLGMVGRGGEPVGGQQYWDLPQPWKWTDRLERKVNRLEDRAPHGKVRS